MNMGFKTMSAEEYRALDADSLEKRRIEVEEEIRSGKTPVEEMEGEVDVLTAEFERRNTEARIHNLRMNQVLGTSAEPIERSGKPADTGDVTDSIEYRTAFKEYITKGTAIPIEYRADENTKTTDVATVIPTMLQNRIVERMDENGMILPLVTHTSYKGGITVPTSTAKPVATWVAEGAGSDRQKKTTSAISFSYHKLRCEISASMEVSTMALSAFESTFVRNVSDAMTIAIEKAIIAGDGTSQPKGILTETPVETVTFASAAPKWDELVKVEAAIPAQYEAGTRWFMTKKNFLTVMGITDNTGQPIARVTYGLGGRLERNILGRTVTIHPYATEMGTHFAGLYDFADYLFNTIYDLGIQRKQDWDTEDMLAKAVMSVDGKCVDTGSLVIVDAGA